MLAGKNIIKYFLSVLFVVSFNWPGLPAHAVTLGFDDSVLYDATSQIEPGGDMGFGDAGIEVTAIFADGNSQTLNWFSYGNSPDGPAGGVLGAGWGLEHYGNTYIDPWWLTTNVALSSLVISGSPGNIVFDVAIDGLGNVLPGNGGPDNMYGTVGSGNGSTFELFMTPDLPDLTVTYSNIVALAGESPVGDLWETLTLDFGSQGFVGELLFIADTDVASTTGPAATVPAPFSLALLGIGLAGLGLARKK